MWAFVQEDGTWRSPIAKFLSERRAPRSTERARRRARRPAADRRRQQPTSPRPSLGELRLELARRFDLVARAAATSCCGSSTSRCSSGTRTSSAGTRCTTRSPRPTGDLRRTRARCARAPTTSCSTAPRSAAARSVSTAPRSSSRCSTLLGISERGGARRASASCSTRSSTARRRTAASRSGIDRIVALLAGRDSIRDVIAFPKTASGADPLTGAPAPVDARAAARSSGVTAGGRRPPAWAEQRSSAAARAPIAASWSGRRSALRGVTPERPPPIRAASMPSRPPPSPLAATTRRSPTNALAGRGEAARRNERQRRDGAADSRAPSAGSLRAGRGTAAASTHQAGTTARPPVDASRRPARPDLDPRRTTRRSRTGAVLRRPCRRQRASRGRCRRRPLRRRRCTARQTATRGGVFAEHVRLVRDVRRTAAASTSRRRRDAERRRHDQHLKVARCRQGRSTRSLVDQAIADAAPATAAAPTHRPSTALDHDGRRARSARDCEHARRRRRAGPDAPTGHRGPQRPHAPRRASRHARRRSRSRSRDRGVAATARGRQ